MLPASPALDDATARMRALRDPGLPWLPDLLGGEAEQLLDAHVPGSSVHERARLGRVSWRPGRSFTAMYERRSSDPASAPDQVVVAVLERAPDDHEPTIRLWDRLDDPYLPGLRSVLAGPDLDAWLDAMGVDPGAVQRRLVTYRPGHRAVVEVRRGGDRLFVKVVRPAAVAGIRVRHEALAPVLPVPRVLGTSEAAGIVVLQALDGESQFDAIRRGGDAAPDAMVELLGRIGTIPSPGRPTASPLERVDEHVRLLSAVMPEQASRLAALAADLGPEDQPVGVTIHGDMHLGQLLVRGGAVVGVLDLDTMGPGRPSDDAANSLAHLESLSLSAARAGSAWHGAVLTFADGLLEAFDTLHDPVDLRRRTAAALLGLAAGQFQGQLPLWPERLHQRVQAAERWLMSSHRLRGGTRWAAGTHRMRTSSSVA